MYSFLDPHKQGKKLAAYIVGIAVAEIVIFVLIRYLIIARYKLVKRLSQLGPEIVMVEEGMGRKYAYADAERHEDEKSDRSSSPETASPQL